MGAKADFIRVLQGPVCRAMSFHFGYFHLRGSQFGVIARKIQSGSIQIVRNTLETGRWAKYDYEHDTFIVGADQHVSDNLIVHEATHAIQDMQGKKRGFVEAEAYAYVAQVMFKAMSGELPGQTSYQELHRNASSHLLGCMFNGYVDSRACPDALRDAATPIAFRLMAKTHLKQSEIDLLLNAIRTTPEYRLQHANPRFNGFKPGAFFSSTEMSAKHYAAVNN